MAKDPAVGFIAARYCHTQTSRLALSTQESNLAVLDLLDITALVAVEEKLVAKQLNEQLDWTLITPFVKSWHVQVVKEKDVFLIANRAIGLASSFLKETLSRKELGQFKQMIQSPPSSAASLFHQSCCSSRGCNLTNLHSVSSCTAEPSLSWQYRRHHTVAHGADAWKVDW